MMMVAFYTHFRSRLQHTFAERMLLAMRFGFGCHVEGRGTIATLGPHNVKGDTGEVR